MVRIAGILLRAVEKNQLPTANSDYLCDHSQPMAGLARGDAFRIMILPPGITDRAAHPSAWAVGTGRETFPYDRVELQPAAIWPLIKHKIRQRGYININKLLLIFHLCYTIGKQQRRYDRWKP